MSKHSSVRSSCTSRRRPRAVVLVVGGDGRGFARQPHIDVAIRVCASSKYGGNGRLNGALTAIRHGRFELVVVLSRWLGHSEFAAVASACRAAGVPILVIAGGMTSAARALSRHLAEVHGGR